MGCTSDIIKLFTGYCNNQIHARHPISLAEKDLLCQKTALKVLSTCSHEIHNWSSYRTCVGGNCSWARKRYWGDQNLEMKTKSQSTIQSRRSWCTVSDSKIYKNLHKLGCIDYLRRFGIYHLRKPINLRAEGKGESLLDAFDSPVW